MKVFRKRVYTSRSFIHRLSLGLASIPVLAIALIAPLTSRKIREEVMLAVTSVVDCRYCSWLHTHLALNNGVDVEELNSTLYSGRSDLLSERELVAILYAQHYADKNGKVDRETKNKLKEHFSFLERIAISAYINAIYVGNLSENTFGALLARLKGYKVKDSQLWLEVVASAISAPILLIILYRSKKDQTVEIEEM